MREYVPPTPRKPITDKTRAEVFLRANGKCERCHCRIVKGQFEVDHRVQLFMGGADDASNMEVLCVPCHRGVKCAADAKDRAKVTRIHKQRAGIPKKGRKLQSRGFEGWRNFDGTISKVER